MPSSRLPGFYKKKPLQRRKIVADITDISEQEEHNFDATALSVERADVMVENVIGTFGLPLAVAVNLRCNDSDILVPMVVEEPSVVAAISNTAKLVRQAGGFKATSSESIMIGQIQLMDVAFPKKTITKLEQSKERLQQAAKNLSTNIIGRGGGVRSFSFRHVCYDEPGESPTHMIVVQFSMDCVDAMGANIINTVAEGLAPLVEEITDEKVGLRILSNYATKRLAKSTCRIPVGLLSTGDLKGEEVASRIANSYKFAYADPWRAATHNKGIMNGIDAVAIATGNDWRAIEAGAHAWASRSGQYRSLSKWYLEEGELVGEMELPIQVGTVGGSIRNHPQVRANLKILGNPRARKLAEVMVTVGLAQNLGAIKALSTEGIQRGHMRMHARNIALLAGAKQSEISPLVDRICHRGDFSVSCASQELAILRSKT